MTPEEWRNYRAGLTPGNRALFDLCVGTLTNFFNALAEDLKRSRLRNEKTLGGTFDSRNQNTEHARNQARRD